MSSPTTPPSPSPSNPPTVTAPGLRIKTGPSSFPTPSPTTDQADNPSPYSDGEPDPIDNAGIPSPDNADQAVPVKIGKRTLTGLARDIIGGASMYVHGIMARTEAAQQAGVWIADAQDMAQIGDPLAAIAARHGAPATAGSQDTADLIAAGIGLITYLAKNIKTTLALRAAARRAAQAARAGILTDPEPAQ